MRRLGSIFLLLFLAFGCKKMEKLIHRQQQLPDPEAAVARPGTYNRITGKYIPPVCRADGSYEQALNCLRVAEVIRFRTETALGTVTRNIPGQERMMLYVGQGEFRGQWRAQKTSKGVVWAFNGAAIKNAPPPIAEMFLWVSGPPDPPKAEGKPKEVARDDKGITYEFTDARNGDRYVAKVDPRGHLAQLTTPSMALTFG